MLPSDVKHLRFFTKLQIIFTDLLDIIHEHVKYLKINDIGGCNHCCNSDLFYKYFFT